MRIADALDPINRRKTALEELVGLVDVPRLSEGFDFRRKEAQSLLPSSERSETETLIKIEKLGEELKALKVPEDLLEEASRIEGLSRRLGIQRKNAEDRLVLQAEVALAESQARSILHDLGREPDLVSAPESARETLRIKAIDRSRIEALVNQRQAVNQAVDAGRIGPAALDKKLTTARRKRDDLKPERDPAPLKKALKRARPTATSTP